MSSIRPSWQEYFKEIVTVTRNDHHVQDSRLDVSCKR